MIKQIPIGDSQAVFGKNECVYQCVLDDFKNTTFIGIMTFNISPKADSLLLRRLKDACTSGTQAIIFTNIPKRFPSYLAPQYALAAKKMIDKYKQQLNPSDYGMRISPFFVFNNHAKIIMTDNMVYWGSSNFSDESFGNIECGSISSDKELIGYLKDTLFVQIREKAVPYYKYNFAIAIANLESLIPACEAARQDLFNAAFEPWSDYDTGFKEVWVYRSTDSGITTKFLREFLDSFSCFEDALSVIDEIIEEYQDSDELPEQVVVLQGLLEEYRHSYESFGISISSLFEDLKEVANYDVPNEACSIISKDYGMEAYDENLDYYAEKAMNEATEEYESIIENSEQTVRDALSCLDDMEHYFKQLHSQLRGLLEVNSKIDNTGVR